MGLAHEKKSYLQEKANLFEIGSIDKIDWRSGSAFKARPSESLFCAPVPYEKEC